jgi:cell division protein FtsW
MTITMGPFGTSSDVRARRQAALDRLQAGDRPGRGGRGAVRRRRPVQRDTSTKVREELGPTPTLYYAIVVIVSVFVMLGLVMVLSATSASRVGGDTSPYSVFERQLLWAVCGLVAMVVAMRVPYQRWRNLVIPGAVLGAGAMLLPFVPGVGTTINDANSWIRFGTYTLQPSEVLKLTTIAFLADHFARHQGSLHLPRRGVLPTVVAAGVTAGLSFVQGDLGSAIVLAGVVLAVALIAGVPFSHLGVTAITGAGGALLAIMSDTRRFNRLTAFRDIEGNKDHLAWQSWQGLLSIANGGLTGSGIGGSNSKLGYLPLAHSDFIFAVIADELGFIGSVAVVGGFCLLVTLGIQAALAAPDQFGSLLAGGIAAWFGLQAIVNLGGVSGLLPVTGLTLPFFSAGGTSLFVSMAAAGLLLNVARRAVTTAPARRRR